MASKTELITVNQAAVIFGISPELIYRALRLELLKRVSTKPTMLNRREVQEWRQSVNSA